tara:strand:+ start:216 stop:866 length:651 start_codon:yes stop_codon:yes gene_type:complete
LERNKHGTEKESYKDKKMHPGGSVPGFRPMPRQLTPAEQRLQRRGTRRRAKQDREIAQAGGFKNMRQMQAAMARMTPEQRMQFQRKNETQFRDIAARNRGEFETRNAKLIERVRRQQQRRMRQRNPMMPTAGISQGRPVRGRTPMPGPAPDSERMKRFQKLMREQQARFNKMQKAQMARAKAAGQTVAKIDPKSLPTLDDAMRAKLRQQLALSRND